MNTLGRQIPGLVEQPYNPCFIHPEDLASLGAQPDDLLAITSDHGSVVAPARPDPTLRRGVVSITHGYGGPPDEDPNTDPFRCGTNVERLLSLTADVQTITAMPLMSAVPVAVKKLVEAVDEHASTATPPD